jgi:hypothetical protein
MPGQGIATIASSIAHAAVLRIIARVVEKNLQVRMGGRVTSDDSTIFLIF